MGWSGAGATQIILNDYLVITRRNDKLTRVRSDVLPAPLVPNKTKDGVVGLRAAARYRKRCRSSGKETATINAMVMATGSPENSLEARLSGEDQVIAFS